MYAALNKALVIDPSGELRDFLRFCAGRLWPKLEIVSYRWARGCPDETFDWKGFDLVVLEERLHVPGDRVSTGCGHCGGIRPCPPLCWSLTS